MHRSTVLAQILCLSLFAALCLAALPCDAASRAAPPAPEQTAAQTQAVGYQIPIITGRHWLDSTNQERLAFVAGMATIIDLEREVQGQHPADIRSTLIPTWSEGLTGLTLTQIASGIDAYYQGHPDKITRPVVEVLWYEVANPRLAAPKSVKR